MECRAAARGRTSILCVQRPREIRGAAHPRARRRVRTGSSRAREAEYREAFQECATGTGWNRTWPTPPLALARLHLQICRKPKSLMFLLYLVAREVCFIPRRIISSPFERRNIRGLKISDKSALAAGDLVAGSVAGSRRRIVRAWIVAPVLIFVAPIQERRCRSRY